MCGNFNMYLSKEHSFVHSLIHSFILSGCFILVRIIILYISYTKNTGWEGSTSWMAHQSISRVSYTFIQTERPCLWEETREPTRTGEEHATLSTVSNLTSGLYRRPWSCEVAIPPCPSSSKLWSIKQLKDIPIKNISGGHKTSAWW